MEKEKDVIAETVGSSIFMQYDHAAHRRRAAISAFLDRSKARRAPSIGLSLAWVNSVRTDSRILEKGLTMFSSTSFDRD